MTIVVFGILKVKFFLSLALEEFFRDSKTSSNQPRLNESSVFELLYCSSIVESYKYHIEL